MFLIAHAIIIRNPCKLPRVMMTSWAGAPSFLLGNWLSLYLIYYLLLALNKMA